MARSSRWRSSTSESNRDRPRSTPCIRRLAEPPVSAFAGRLRPRQRREEDRAPLTSVSVGLPSARHGISPTTPSPCLRHGCAACCHDTRMSLTLADVRRLERAGHRDFCELGDDGTLRLCNVAGRCVFLTGSRCDAYPDRRTLRALPPNLVHRGWRARRGRAARVLPPPLRVPFQPGRPRVARAQHRRRRSRGCSAPGRELPARRRHGGRLCSQRKDDPTRWLSSE